MQFYSEGALKAFTFVFNNKGKDDNLTIYVIMPN